MTTPYTMLPGSIPFKVVEWLKAHQRMLPPGEKFKATLAVIGEAIGHDGGDLNQFLGKARQHGILTSEPTAHKHRLWMLGDGVPLQPSPELAAFDARIEGAFAAADRQREARQKITLDATPTMPEPEPEPRPTRRASDWPTPDDGVDFFAGNTVDGCLVIQKGDSLVQFNRKESLCIARAARGIE